jgi:hypothetical protein
MFASGTYDPTKGIAVFPLQTLRTAVTPGGFGLVGSTQSALARLVEGLAVRDGMADLESGIMESWPK